MCKCTTHLQDVILRVYRCFHSCVNKFLRFLLRARRYLGTLRVYSIYQYFFRFLLCSLLAVLSIASSLCLLFLGIWLSNILQDILLCILFVCYLAFNGLHIGTIMSKNLLKPQVTHPAFSLVFETLIFHDPDSAHF